MRIRFPPLQAWRERSRIIACACVAITSLAAGCADAATALTDSVIGLAAGAPQQVLLTDTWTGTQYQVAVQADRDAFGRLVAAHLVVARAGGGRNLVGRPHRRGPSDDGRYAALDLAQGPENSAFWDQHIPVTPDDDLVVRVEDAQVRPVPGAPAGQAGSAEITALRLHVFLDAPTRPQPAPKAFKSEQYGLTFEVPHGSSYCALSADWVGSDHGTVIFLAPPRRCFGAGYPSSGRGFEGRAPRIEVFYAYDVTDEGEGSKPPVCKAIGLVRFLGQARRLCKTSSRHGVQVSVSAGYSADQPAEADLTLVTSRSRLATDLVQFERLLESARTCTATWTDDKGGKPFTTGSGPPCPADARWF